MKQYKIKYQEDNKIKTIVLEANCIANLKNDENYPDNVLDIKNQLLKSELKTGSTINILNLLNELNIMLQAKLPLGESVDLLKKSYKTTTKEYQVLVNIQTSINNGIPISKGLQVYEKRLPSIVFRFFQLGEENNNINEAIGSLCLILNKQKEYKNKLVEAFIYPLVLVVSMIVALGIIFTFVIPKFEYMFSQLGAKLPLITTILLDIKEFFFQWGILILMITSIVYIILFYLYRKDSKFKYKIDKILLKYIPYVSRLLLVDNLHKLFMVLKQLTKSKYQFPIALQSAKVVVDNSFMSNKIDFIYSCLENGEDISSSFSKVDLFDDLTIRLLSSGEKGNQIETVLEKLESIYDQQLNRQMKSFVKSMEFILIGLIGILILFVMLAIFLPVWEMSTVLN